MQQVAVTGLHVDELKANLMREMGRRHVGFNQAVQFGVGEHNGIVARIDQQLASDEEDDREVCGTIAELVGRVGEWQVEGRGKFPAVLEEFRMRLESLAFPCQMVAFAPGWADEDEDEAAEAPALDRRSLAGSFTAWSGDLRSAMRVKSSWGTLALWVGGPLLLGALIVFLRNRMIFSR